MVMKVMCVFADAKGQRMPNVGDDFKTRSWFEFRQQLMHVLIELWKEK